MRTLPWNALACALLAVPAAAGPLKADKFFPYPMKCDRLENGLTVCRVPFEAKGLVAYYTAMRVGSRNEVEKGRSGFAHFFEHVMFKGTKTLPGPLRQQFLAEAGFAANAFTTPDITVFHNFGPNGRLLDLIAIEADRFEHLEYSEPEFRTEALAVLGEYHKSAANPRRMLDEVLQDTAFSASPYKHTTMGFYADIQKMPEAYEYSREFFRRWYTPDNAFIFVVGDFDDAQVMAAIRQGYGAWAGRAARVEIPLEPRHAEERKANLDWATPTLPRYAIAWNTPASSLANLDAATRSILEEYLAGKSSPLYRQLVLEQQRCEQLYAFEATRRDPALLAFVAELKDLSGRADVAGAFEREVKALRDGKVDAERVAEIQSNMRYGFLMDLESPEDVAHQLAWHTGIFGAPDALERHFENVAKVRPKDLVEFAKKYLADTNRTVVTLTPPAAATAEGGAK